MKNLPILLAPLALASIAAAQDLRVNVILENVAPSFGTFQTPIWVGFHDGTFDSYDGGTLANSLPIPGSDALERLAEDGDTGPITRDFAILGAGRLDATLPGPNGPIAPGERTTRTFVLNPNDVRDRYFSYASMVIPSNDAFIANGNPMAHPIFDASGNFIASDFFVAGQDAVNDAGTELNDEVPLNTAFFGQMAPDTGVTENNPIITHPGFLPRGTVGVLDDTRFRNGDFTLGGYPFLRVGFRAAPAVTDVRLFSTLALGIFEVPAVASPAAALSGAALVNNGEELIVAVQAFGLADLTAAHLHLGAAGSNGPVVADLLSNAQPSATPANQFFLANLSSEDLVGPLADFPLDELVRRIEAGEIYLNLHTSANPSGELRGQLGRF
ncbi:MAG: spondin domain-containing protein [Planctomycetota bacterium]